MSEKCLAVVFQEDLDRPMRDELIRLVGGFNGAAMVEDITSFGLYRFVQPQRKDFFACSLATDDDAQSFLDQAASRLKSTGAKGKTFGLMLCYEAERGSEDTNAWE